MCINVPYLPLHMGGQFPSYVAISFGFGLYGNFSIKIISGPKIFSKVFSQNEAYQWQEATWLENVVSLILKEIVFDSLNAFIGRILYYHKILRHVVVHALFLKCNNIVLFTIPMRLFSTWALQALDFEDKKTLLWVAANRKDKFWVSSPHYWFPLLDCR